MKATVPVNDWMETLAGVVILLLSLVGIAAVFAHGLLLP